jgi:quercetin dioxygenase-like cupin family protein
MPFYSLFEMDGNNRPKIDPSMRQTIAGELMKVGLTVYAEGEGPLPHFHPNEEQFMLVVGGRFKMILGDDERIVEPGIMVHIPRNTRHGVRAVGGPAAFFAAKSPVGTGDMRQDYNKSEGAEEIWERLTDRKAP